MTPQAPLPHQPIMVKNIAAAMEGVREILDMTAGACGHSRALMKLDDTRTIIAMDQDKNVQLYVETLQQEFPDRVVYVHSNFRHAVEALRDAGIEQVDGILMDIGVSSMQLDEAARGFSFRNEGPLTMRMSDEGLRAEDVVNDYSEQELTKIIRHLGEESMARKIVQNIIRHREKARITTTTQLAAIIGEVKQRRGAKTDPATKTFQAIRMHVNDELGALEEGLLAAESLLRPDGVLAVLSFHSLEDRLVKRFLQARIKQPQGSRHLPPVDQPAPIFELLHNGAKKASDEEIAQNPRARSARLRLARRTSAQVRSVGC